MTNPLITSIVAVFIAYLIGSLSFAVIVSKLFGLPDPHTYGSGNPGATNVLRTGKKSAAILTLAGDAAKGWFAVWVAQQYAAEFQLRPITLACVVAMEKPVSGESVWAIAATSCHGSALVP